MEPLSEYRSLLAKAGNGARTDDIAGLRRAMDGALRRWAGEPPALPDITDRRIAGPYRDVPIRVYRPVIASEPLPVLVFCHGSGFVLGSVETHDGLARRLALATGAIVVSVDYLLAPEHPFPAAIEEAFAVLRWVATGGLGEPADARRVAVCGDSAGGAIVSGLSRMARESDEVSLRAQVLIYPACATTCDTPSWQRYGSGYFLEQSMMRWFWAQYLPSGAGDPRAVPLPARDLSGLPPTVLLSAGCDPLQDEGRAYAGLIRDNGTEVRSCTVDGAIHGFMTMFAVSPGALLGVRLVAAALEGLL